MSIPYFNSQIARPDKPATIIPRNGGWSRQPSNRPKAILFDLDGTLIDTMGIFARIAADVLHTHAHMDTEVAAQRYFETSGIPFHQQLALIVPNHPRAAVMSEEFESRKIEAVDSVTMRPGTVSALQALRDEGIGIGVSSNNFQTNVSRFASASPVMFDFALGYTENLHKGEPHISHAGRLYGCLTSELLFVGDSLSDSTMAEACAVPFIGVIGTHPEHRFRDINPNAVCISSIESLLPLIIPNPSFGDATHDKQ